MAHTYQITKRCHWTQVCNILDRWCANYVKNSMGVSIKACNCYLTAAYGVPDPESLTTQLKIASNSRVVCGDVMMLCSVILCHAKEMKKWNVAASN